jgi:diguanylate cyclase (GGDEF)-like protein
MQKIAILYDASQAVMSTFELDEVLAQILAIVRGYFQMQNAAVFLLDPATEILYVRSHFGRSETPDRKLRVGEGLIGHAAKIKRPLYVPDVSKDARYVKGFEDTKSELAIPLMVRDQVVGVLDLQADRLDFFDEETIDLLTLFSTQASIALENARLYTTEQRRAQQMEAINAVARSTTALVDLEELLYKACTEILQRFNVDHVAFTLMEEGDLYVRSHKGQLTPSVQLGERLPRGTGIASRALETGQTVLVNDVSMFSGYVKGFEEARAEMCVPLIYFGEKLGVLALESAIKNSFDQSDIQPLESVGDICAAAIQNARHFQTTRQLAYLDGLTGAFNRRFFEMRIMEELERAARYNAPLSVVMIDLDNFKKLNDEFGHLLGDEVLRQVTNIFHQHLRKGDVMCRYGGEEFAVLLPQTSGENALDVAEKLRRTVEGWHFPGVARKVTISVGVADHPDFGRTRDEIVAAADAALYHAKVSGRNCVSAARHLRKTSV